jgi:hypothetical protein
MVGLGTRTTIERVEIGNSQPKAARASALPDSSKGRWPEQTTCVRTACVEGVITM